MKKRLGIFGIFLCLLYSAIVICNYAQYRQVRTVTPQIDNIEPYKTYATVYEKYREEIITGALAEQNIDQDLSKAHANGCEPIYVPDDNQQISEIAKLSIALIKQSDTCNFPEKEKFLIDSYEMGIALQYLSSGKDVAYMIKGRCRDRLLKMCEVLPREQLADIYKEFSDLQQKQISYKDTIHLSECATVDNYKKSSIFNPLRQLQLYRYSTIMKQLSADNPSHPRKYYLLSNIDKLLFFSTYHSFYNYDYNWYKDRMCGTDCLNKMKSYLQK
ncbi:MAG TPA: hypothetical protein VHV83_17790 [Armatimonadota bacterium]|nr:hypothetical protein [Armatimonadota bacterium]